MYFQVERIVGCIAQLIPELSPILTDYAGYYSRNIYNYAMCIVQVSFIPYQYKGL
jgi:hypothetical protein